MDKKRWIALGAALVVSALLIYGMEGVQTPGGGTGPWQEHVLQGEGFEKVAVLQVRGEIISEADPGGFSGGAVAEQLVSQLRQAAEDDSVKAVVLRINTPGGSVVASNAIAEEIEAVRATGKPVLASLGEVAASGGYLISAPTDRIISDPATITGSIGVIMVLLNLEDATGKLGIDPVVLKAGRFKDMGSSFRDLTSRERQMFQDLLDEAHTDFKDVVMAGRDLSQQEVDEVADGRIFSGRTAEQLDLVDELGGFDDALEAAKEMADLEDALVVEYSAPFSLTNLLWGVRAGLGGIDPVAEAEKAFGATGPRLAYLYVP